MVYGGISMEFDAKQKVLFAIYLEYQKDIPEMDNVTANALGLEYDVFKIAVDKLENEGLIRGTGINRGPHGDIWAVFLTKTKMTNYGLQYVENKLQVEPEKTGGEKVKEIAQKAVSWSWNEAKDFAAKVLSEIIQSQV